MFSVSLRNAAVAMCLFVLGHCLPVRVAAQQRRAQAARASISGNVTDQNGNVVLEATLKLTGPAGFKEEKLSDTKGNYSFTGLHAGIYTLLVTAPSLPPLKLENVEVHAGDNIPLDAQLQGEMPGAKPKVEAQGQDQDPAPAISAPQLPAQVPAMPKLASPVGADVSELGTISGIAMDPTGAVLPNAIVILIEPDGSTRETKTDEQGSYFFAGLKPGMYTVTVSAANFAEQRFENIAVKASEKVPLDITLQPAKSNEQVSVVGNSAGQVEVESATVSGTITEKEVVKIGLNGRNFSQLIALAPGVSNQTGQDEAKVGVQGSVKYSVNGGRVEYNTFEVDGSDVLNTGLNGASSTLMVYPSLDAIQEVKVLTSNYGAQYGRTASGTVQVTTKSGGAALHGNAYEFVRNEAFNARNYFDIGTKAPLYRRQDFGGTLGGPLTIPHFYNLQKNKTLFFFSEEVRREKTPTEYNQAVPSLKERGLILTPQGVTPNLATGSGGIVYQDFNFTDVCPLPGTSAAAGFTRQQFPDCPSISNAGSPNLLVPLYHLNQPQNGSASGVGIDKNALTILNAGLIPLPDAAFGCNVTFTNIDPTDVNHCYDATISPAMHWREELFRIDHILTNQLKLSFRYVHDSWDTTVLDPQWSILRTTNPGAATFPTVQNRFVGPGTSLVLRVTDTLSTSLLNDAVFSYSNSAITLADQNGSGGAVFQRNPSLDQPLVSDPSAAGQCNPSLSLDPVTGIPQCGIGYLFRNGFGGKITGVEFLGTNAAYGGRGFATDPAYMPWGHTNPTFSFRDDVLKSRGKHTLQMGLQYVYSQRNQTNNAIGSASGELQGFLTFSNLVQSTGNAFADFLLQNNTSGTGVVTSYIESFTQDSSQRRYYQRYQLAEPYFQDDWKVSPRLTLNLGLRVSLFGTYREKNKNAWNWQASRFNSSRFAVDSFSGVLLDKLANSSVVTVDTSTRQLAPSVISDLGLVQCGLSGVPAGCMKGHVFNPAPRIGFAWDPKGDAKTSIRGGYGIFFEHGTGNESNTGSLEASAPLVLSMTQPFPLNYPCIGNVGYGPAFDPSTSGCTLDANHPAPPAGSAYPLNVTAIPTKAVWPYAQQWSFGVQREIPAKFVLNAAYVGSKGTHLTLERNLNQMVPLPLSENPFGPNEPLTLADCTVPVVGFQGAVPGDGTMPFQLQSGVLITPQSPAYAHMQAACASKRTPNVNSLPRPYPGLGQVLSLENAANSNYHAAQISLRRTSGALTAGLSYSYSHSIDNSSDRSDPVMVDSYNLRGNRASSNFDQRHLLSFSYIYSLKGLTKWMQDVASGVPGDPVREGEQAPEPQEPSRLLKAISSNWQISGVTLFASGTPFTVINSAGNTGISLTDNAGVSSGFGIAASYPDVNRGLPRAYNNSQSVGPLLGNPSQFVAPRGLTFGNAGRNYLNNPSRLNFDMAIARHFKATESSDVEFRAEVFNLFNQTQFRIYDPDNPGGTGNNVISCYAGPMYSAGFHAPGGADCVTGASFLHPLNAHRPRTIQFGLKWGF